MEKFDWRTCDSDEKYIWLNYPLLSWQSSFFQVGKSAIKHEEAEIHQDPGNNKKKREPRRRKFNWFSDSY